MTLPPPAPWVKPVGAIRLQREPLGFLQALQQRYGDVFRLDFGTGLRINAWVCDPALAAQVIEAGAEELEAGPANSILRPIVGDGSLLLLTGQEHEERREQAWREFDTAHRREDGERVAEITARQVVDWRPGEVIRLWTWVRDLTMKSMLRVVFGLDPYSSRSEALSAAFSELVELSGSPPMFFPSLRHYRGPLSCWAHFERCRAKLDALIYREIAQRRDDPGLDSRHDILSDAIRLNTSKPRTFTADDIRDELVTLMIAGKETAAGGLAWTLELLLRNRSELERVRQQVREGRTEYLDAAIHEALRLRVPLFAIGRGAVRDYRLGRFTIPAGMGVAVPLLLVYRSPVLFDQPTLFRPERYLDPAWPAWVPFGGGIRSCKGIRSCIGARFAPMLIALVLRAILEHVEEERAELELVDPRAEQLQLRAGAFVVPDREVQVRVTRSARAGGQRPQPGGAGQQVVGAAARPHEVRDAG
jgi:hypothetical protein